MNDRMKTEVVGVHLEGEYEWRPECLDLNLTVEKDGALFSLSGELLEAAITAQGKIGKKVRAFLYCNPNNPLGEVYSRELTLELMEVCAKYKIHFISDEIYALSHFAQDREENPFQSVLSFRKDEVHLF